MLHFPGTVTQHLLLTRGSDQFRSELHSAKFGSPSIIVKLQLTAISDSRGLFLLPLGPTYLQIHRSDQQCHILDTTLLHVNQS